MPFRRWFRRPETERDADARLAILSRRLKRCDDSLRENPDDVDALFTKGMFYAQISEYRRAIACLDRVIDLDPGYPGIWYAMSTVHARMGNVELARRWAEWARSRGS